MSGGPTLWSFLALPAIIGPILLLVGFRGRRIGNHPHCRRCGFDLVGRPPTPADREPGPSPCPECGADISRPGATVIGVRRRHRVPLLLGAALVALAVAGGGWLVFGGGRLNTYKPVWMLRAEMAGTSPTAAAAARSELDRRIRTLGTVTPPQAESIAAVILAHQADQDRPWDPNEGVLLEVAHANNLLAPQTWAAYAQQAANFKVRARSKLEEGGAWAVDIVSDSPRLGNAPGSAGQLALSPALLEATVSGKPVPFGTEPGRFGRQFNMSYGGSSWNTERPRFDLPPGDYTLVTRWKLRVVPGYGTPRPTNQVERETITEWEVSRSTPFTVVPRGTPLVTAVRDESLRAAIQKCVRADQCEINGASPEPDAAAGKPETLPMLYGMLYFDTPPMDLAFDVFWRITPKTGDAGAKAEPFDIPVGTATARKPDGRMTMGVGTSQSLPWAPWMRDVSRVDIILRSSVAAALTTVNIDRIWDGEVVIEGVEVTGPASAAKADPGSEPETREPGSK